MTSRIFLPDLVTPLALGTIVDRTQHREIQKFIDLHESIFRQINTENQVPISMGAPGATLEQAVQACQMAGIHQDIENLPKGYQTGIGERGIGLSGGQRQRVAIARALLKRPKVLIFDESTSGLDPVSAEKIAETVNALRGKVSMLFIAHKVPASLKVDKHVELKPSATALGGGESGISHTRDNTAGA